MIRSFLDEGGWMTVLPERLGLIFWYSYWRVNASDSTFWFGVEEAS